MKSIKSKLYLFVVAIILIVAIGAITLSYMISSNQIDRVYKHVTTSSAETFAKHLDGNYLRDLRILLESDEYQAVRNKAELEKNDTLVKNYLESKNMWNQYSIIRNELDEYIDSMDEIKYVYIVAHGDENATQDMYMVDDSEQTLYDSAGRWEDREDVYLGQDLTKINPNISYSDEWGWLVSDFAPVYDSNGNCVCIVGCDVDYSNIIASKQNFLIMSIAGVSGLIVIVLIIGLTIVNKNLIIPLKTIANEIHKFKPTNDTLNSGIISIPEMTDRIDEIGQIYDSIRGTQFEVVDYFKSITNMREDIDTLKGEIDEQNLVIDKLNIESSKDALTGVNNRNAYLKKIKELSTDQIKLDYAIVMIDINNLKEMNDQYGHKVGDWYIQGCCKLICNVFKHSPVYRYGGDEFVVIVDGDDFINRQNRFNELVESFDKASQKETDRPWEKLSAACGMAEKSTNDWSPEFVFKRADENMYKNKMQFKKEHSKGGQV